LAGARCANKSLTSGYEPVPDSAAPQEPAPVPRLLRDAENSWLGSTESMRGPGVPLVNPDQASELVGSDIPLFPASCVPARIRSRGSLPHATGWRAPGQNRDRAQPLSKDVVQRSSEYPNLSRSSRQVRQ